MTTDSHEFPGFHLPGSPVFGGALDSYASLALDETWTFATVGPLAGTWQRHDVAVTPPARRGGPSAGGVD